MAAVVMLTVSNAPVHFEAIKQATSRSVKQALAQQTEDPELLQANMQLQEQVQQLLAVKDSLSEAAEMKDAQLLDLHAQVDLLRNHASETEAWLTKM